MGRRVGECCQHSLKAGERCGAVLFLRAALQGSEGALTLAGVVSGPAQ